MKINRIYNKSVTTLSPGEVVEERYNGSNAKFAVFKVAGFATGLKLSFSALTNFEYISWGDGSITFGPTTTAASHTYTFQGIKPFTIVVYGIENFGEMLTSNQQIFNVDVIKEAYFGEGVKIWSNNGGSYAFSGTGIEIVRNVSDVPGNFCSGASKLKEVTFNIDCKGISTSAFSSACTDSAIRGKCLLVIPKHIATIADNAFNGSGFKVCIEYEEGKKPDGYSEVNNTYYYYSETEPTEEGNYWHYVNSEPVVWEIE